MKKRNRERLIRAEQELTGLKLQISRCLAGTGCKTLWSLRKKYESALVILNGKIPETFSGNAGLPGRIDNCGHPVTGAASAIHP